MDLPSNEDIPRSLIEKGDTAVGSYKNDTRRFEHNVFKSISEDFPFLYELHTWNVEPQNDKQH
jgi:hypothetical protein